MGPSYLRIFLSSYLPLFKLAVPYVAVLVGLVWLRHAWLTLLLYHGLIGVGLAVDTNREPLRVARGWSLKACLLLVSPAVLIVPVFVLLRGTIFGSNDVGIWLHERALQGPALIVFLIYFVLFNPLLEEAHWAPLRHVSPPVWLRHAAFAGYHVLVLYTLLRPSWCAVAFAFLMTVSWLWGHTAYRCGGPLVPLLSHLAGDAAIVMAVWMVR